MKREAIATRLEELFPDIRSGSASAATRDEFYGLTFRYALAVSRSLLKHFEDAEDTAEACAVNLAWERRAELQKLKKFVGYLTVAARHAAIDTARANARRQRFYRYGVRPFQVTPPGRDDEARAQCLLGRLSGRERELLTLRVIDDRPYKEIARILKMSERAAMSRFSRIRKKLRTLFPRW